MEMVLYKAQDEYQKLRELYLELISNPEQKLEDFAYLDVGPIFDDNLRLEFFGKVAEIRFSMVIDDGAPVGQATFTLIKNEDTPQYTEKAIWSVWFDYHGRACFDNRKFATMQSVNRSGCLIRLVEEAITALLSSEEFKPATNIGESKA